MTALPEACTAIAAWLPQAAELTAQPDADGSSGHGQPGSRPPWNAAAANAHLDAHEGLRRLETAMRRAVTGRPGIRRGGSDANTAEAIKAIEHLGAGMTAAAAAEAARILDRWSLAVQQLAAIDEAERWLKVSGVACPYCGYPMLRMSPRSGRVTCMHFGACFDAEGNHPQGLVDRSVGGDPMVSWADGLCQYAQVEGDP